MILERLEREDDRGKSLDSKITTLLSGVVAFIGFSLRINPSPWTASAAALYLVPLIFIFDAMRTRLEKQAPTAEALSTYFPAYPVRTLKVAVSAMLEVDEANEKINDEKAGRIDLAMIATGVVTAIVLAMQLILSLLSHEGSFPGGSVYGPVTVGQPPAAAPPVVVRGGTKRVQSQGSAPKPAVGHGKRWPSASGTKIPRALPGATATPHH